MDEGKPEYGSDMAREIAASPHLLREMWEARMCRRHPVERDDMYCGFNRTLEMVREEWPGVTGAQIDKALGDAARRIPNHLETSGRVRTWFNELVVISVYLGDAAETFQYARDRLIERFGRDHFWQWNVAYTREFTAEQIRYAQDANGQPSFPVYRDCVRIDVLDVFAHRAAKGTVVSEVRDHRLAGVAALFAAAQHPEWIRRSDPIYPEHQRVPGIIIGGIQVNAPHFAAWSFRPALSHHHGCLYLNAAPEDGLFTGVAVPRYVA